MKKIIIPLLFICSMGFGQMFSAQNAESNVTDTNIIGTQSWLKYNLNVDRLNDGTLIPNVTNTTTWRNITSCARCFYNNDSITYAGTYGALYNGHCVSTNKLCPTGYHVPDSTEWKTLIDYSGGLNLAGKLKETGITHWASNVGAYNFYSFKIVPNGYRDYLGTYGQLTNVSSLWTSYEYFTGYLRAILFNETAEVTIGQNMKAAGLAVRCIKD